MKASRFLKLAQKAGKRVHLVGDYNAGALVALDIEARWFAVLNGEIVNRVNPEAIEGQSTREKYLNPGGDGLWPAPEGTTLGYQYATGTWRVPPGLIAARFRTTGIAQQTATVVAEVDLVNDHGLGVPTVFSRSIAVAPNRKGMTLRVTDSITYVGRDVLRRKDCLLAPWSLCQFDCGPGCEAVFPCTDKSAVWDLYEPSEDQQQWDKRFCHTRTDGSQRYQIAMDSSVPWFEFRDPRRGLKVRRRSLPLPSGQSYVDIRDAAPNVPPGKKGVRYSVYDDPTCFMEMEAVGGCPATIAPNTEMKVVIATQFVQST